MSTLLKYPYKWGVGIVNALVEKYARGTYYLSRLLDIAPGELRHYLVLLLCSGNSVKWESVKRLIIYNQGNNPSELDAYSPGIRKELYRRLVAMATDDVLDDAWQLKGLDNTMFIDNSYRGRE